MSTVGELRQAAAARGIPLADLNVFLIDKYGVDISKMGDEVNPLPTQEGLPKFRLADDPGESGWSLSFQPGSPVIKLPEDKAEGYLDPLKAVPRAALNVGVGLPLGFAKGGFDVVSSLFTGLKARSEVNELMRKVESPDLSQLQRNAIIDRIQGVSDALIQTDPVFKAYKDVDKDSEDRFKKDSFFINMISDMGEVSKSLPLLMEGVIDAAFAENPEAMRNMGFMISGGGIASTLSILNPANAGRNFGARPVSFIMSAAPVGRIVLKSPKALSAVREKFGSKADKFLNSIDTADNHLRKAWQATGETAARVTKPFVSVAESAGEAVKSVGRAEVGRLFDKLLPGTGVTAVKEVVSGGAPVARAGERVSRLMPGQRFKTLKDLADSFVAGAKAGLFIKEPINVGLVYALGRSLWPNTKWSRSMSAAMGQFLRHTSAQSNAPQELAVRAVMMASAAERNKVRIIAKKIAKIFEDDEAVLASGDPDAIALIPAGRIGLWKEFHGGEFRSGSITPAIRAIEASLRDPDIPKARRSALSAQLKALRDEAAGASVRKIKGGDPVLVNRSVADLADEMGAAADALGVKGDVAKLLKSRLSNVADRNAILLQHADVARAVIERLVKYEGVSQESAIRLIGRLADEPLFGERQVSVGLSIPRLKKDGKPVLGPDGKPAVDLVNLDSLVRRVVEGMPLKKQREVQAGIASNAALRYSNMLTEAAMNRAMKAEALKGGIIGSKIGDVPFDEVSAEAYAYSLASALVKKDDTPGGIGIPTAIPGSAGATDTASALRVIARGDDAKAIFKKQFGDDPSPTELANFRRSLEGVASEVADYRSLSGTELRSEIVQALARNKDAPRDLRRLAQGLASDRFAVSPGMFNTLSWHRKMINPKSSIMRSLQRTLKANLTVRNPISHANNTLGNLGLMMSKYGEDPFTFIANQRRDAAVFLKYRAGTLEKARRGSDQYYSNRAASIYDQTGLGNTDFVAGELLKQGRAELLGGAEAAAMNDFLASLKETKIGVKIRKALSATDEMLSKTYGAEDNMPKMRFGMEAARTALRDLDDLKVGSTYKLKTSPVSSTLVRKGADGRIYKKGASGWKPLTEQQIDKMVASYARTQVTGLFLDYTEKSGLNRIITDSPLVSGFVPFFTFTHKAMGLGGRKGFLENVLFGGDGIVSTDPKIIARQVKNLAEVATRRALLVNSMRQFGTRDKELLGRALAFDPAMPSMVMFDLMTDPDALMYRDYASMNSFAPAEMKLRALAFIAGKIGEGLGLDKGKNLTAQQKQFYRELKTGQVASPITLGSIAGIGRGPGLNFLELAINGFKDRYGNAVDWKKETLKRAMPIALPSPIGISIMEALSNIPGLEGFSGAQYDADDRPLNESRIRYIIRRLLYKGGRKVRFAAGSNVQSVWRNKVRLLNQNGQILTKNFKRRVDRLETERAEIEKAANKAGVDPSLFEGMAEKDAALKVAEANFEAALTSISKVLGTELERLNSAYELIKEREKTKR